MLVNLWSIKSHRAHGVRQTLAAQFDWCLNKAEACQAQLDAPLGQFGERLGVCPYQSIFDAAMEGGCIGAGHESFGAGKDESSINCIVF